MNCNEEFLKTGPCSISYRGEHIGVTLDSPLLNFEPGFYEAQCNRIGYKTVRKVIANMNIIISTDLKEINSNFAKFFDASSEAANVVFNEDVLLTGGGLCLSPLSEDSGIEYYFPRTVLVPESAYAYKKNKDYHLKIHFEVHEDSEGILMHKYSR